MKLRNQKTIALVSLHDAVGQLPVASPIGSNYEA